MLTTVGGCGGGGGSTSAAPANNGSTATGTGPSAMGPGSLAAWLLVGGMTRPTFNNVYLDPELDPGEVFIIPQYPLVAGATYQVSFTITTATDPPFGNTWTFQTNGMSTAGTNPLATLNTLRAESGVTSLTTHSALTTSSTKHAGYQAIENGNITHGETNAANALFVDNDFSNRISRALTGTTGSWIPGTNVEYEDVASLGGVPAINLLWNTVYHRIPMMRSQATRVGFGDRASAQATYPSKGVPPDTMPGSTGWGYATLDFAGDSSIAATAAQWPANNATDVDAVFDNSSETPHPIGFGNANGTTPDAGLVGPPIHIILPTSANIQTIRVSVIKQ